MSKGSTQIAAVRAFTMTDTAAWHEQWRVLVCVNGQLSTLWPLQDAMQNSSKSTTLSDTKKCVQHWSAVSAQLSFGKAMLLCQWVIGLLQLPDCPVTLPGSQ